MSTIVVANEPSAATSPSSGVLVINVRPRSSDQAGWLIRLSSALDDAEPEVTVVTDADDVQAAVAAFLGRFSGPKS